MATSNSTLACGPLKIPGVQILPCFEDDGLVTAQINGPDVGTQFWSVYERWSDGRAVVNDDYDTQGQAIEAAKALAETYRVEIEPYPWVVALCRADGWEVVPFERSCDDDKRGYLWKYRKDGECEGGYPSQDASETEFAAWLECLYHAAVCA
jgi:hypothetical protein